MSSTPDHVKIYFKLDQDEEGYPPVDWESLWAVPANGNEYVLDNTPFYALGVSSGDTVSAASINDRMVFSAVTKLGGHSTIRVIAFEESIVPEIRESLTKLGCTSELSNISTFFSIDIPPRAEYDDVINLLKLHATSGQIDYEESAIQH
ncbi:DUF4265 domain-containing protein [Lysobacter enzymogenes]|uniref:DUF4265 domain-containing protein n=1 Tax=Lysobacter enzymogenes TaxID=69 RepID=UPI00374783FA